MPLERCIAMPQIFFDYHPSQTKFRTNVCGTSFEIDFDLLHNQFGIPSAALFIFPTNLISTKPLKLVLKTILFLVSLIPQPSYL